MDTKRTMILEMNGNNPKSIFDVGFGEETPEGGTLNGWKGSLWKGPVKQPVSYPLLSLGSSTSGLSWVERKLVASDKT